jgi:hypothetical protein
VSRDILEFEARKRKEEAKIDKCAENRKATQNKGNRGKAIPMQFSTSCDRDNGRKDENGKAEDDEPLTKRAKK